MQWSSTHTPTFWALFKWISCPFLPPFYKVSSFFLLIIWLMVSFIFCPPNWAVVKNLHRHNFSCLLQHDNSVQVCFFSKSHSVILHRQAQPVFGSNSNSAFSSAHFHPMTGAKLDHSWFTDQIIRHWAALIGLGCNQGILLNTSPYSKNFGSQSVVLDHI